jgi:hypothetical protein
MFSNYCILPKAVEFYWGMLSLYKHLGERLKKIPEFFWPFPNSRKNSCLTWISLSYSPVLSPLLFKL